MFIRLLHKHRASPSSDGSVNLLVAAEVGHQRVHEATYKGRIARCTAWGQESMSAGFGLCLGSQRASGVHEEGIGAFEPQALKPKALNP